MIRQRPTKTITNAYTTTDSDNGYRIICNSSLDFTITLHSPTGRYNFDLEIDNKGIGIVTVGDKKLTQDTHAHIGNDNGIKWVISMGGASLSDIILFVNNKHELPSIGDVNYIYITKDEHAMYLWDSVSVTYQVLGLSSIEIESISGGIATTNFINE